MQASIAKTKNLGKINMAWLSKLLENTVNLVSSGPLGYIGNGALKACTRKTSGKFENDSMTNSGSLQKTEEQQAFFFITTFSLLAELSKVDGAISDSEVQVVDQIMVDELRMDERAHNYAGQIFNFARKSNNDFMDYINQFGSMFAGQSEVLLCLIDLLLRVAAADGFYHPEEELLIKHSLGPLGITEKQYNFLKLRYVEKENLEYSILFAYPNDSDEVIIENSTKLKRRYHPDEVIKNGFPPEFEKFSQNRYQDIIDAYAKVKKARGLP